MDINTGKKVRTYIIISGSTADGCHEEYRGPTSFSEPETQVIKQFVDSHQNIKFCFDVHAYGNDYVIPNPYNREMLKGTPYEEFEKEAEIDKSHK